MEAKPEKVKVNKTAVLRRLLNVSYPETSKIVLGLVALVVNAATNLSFPDVMRQALDQSGGAASTSSGVALLLTPFLSSSVSAFISENFFVLRALSLFVAGSMASWTRVYCLGTAKESIAATIRKALFDSYMDKDKEFFDCGTKGDLIVAMNEDASAAADTMTDTFANGLRSLNSAINGSIALYISCPSLFGVTIGLIPVLGVAGMKMSKMRRLVATSLRAKQADLMTFAMERIDGITTVRLNGKEEKEKQAYSGIIEECKTLTQRAEMASGAFFAFTNIATNLSLVSILYFGGKLIKSGQLSAGALAGFAMQSALVGMGFSGLSTFYSDLTKDLDAANRVFDLIDRNQVSSTEKAVPATPMGLDDKFSVSEDGSSDGITFTGVSFRYKSRPDNLVLDNMDLKIAPNSITAIVGRSGAGKSTIMSIIAGLHRPTSGSVTIQGVDVRSVSRSWVRKQVGVVEQSANLLSGTIASNIAYGKDDATVEDVTAAAIAADAFDFISSFPDGFETQVGAGGKLLSGGQQARIALARALIKDPPYLLLDEATGSLDRDTEAGIVQTLLKLSRRKVIIAFTHSEAVMKAAAAINVVEKGRLAAVGTHQELSAQGRLAEAISDL